MKFREASDNWAMIPGKRAGQVKEYLNADYPGYRVQGPDECPNCGNVILWVQELEVWTEDMAGQMVPFWDECPSWSADCLHCGCSSVDAYGDGALCVYWPEDDSNE